MFKRQNFYFFIIIIIVSVEYFSDCAGYNLISPSYNNNLRFKRELRGCRTCGECPSPVIENGKYEVLGNPQYVSGDPIPNFASLIFSCINDNYTLTTINSSVHCINGNFESELPKCVPSCAAILSTSIDVKCELNGVKLDCSKKVPEGTIASMKCKTHYEEIGPGPPAAICFGGSWDVPLKRCNPECGVLVPKAELLIVNGTEVKKGEFPWHVAIYRQRPEKPLSYLCGGSIISVKLILSAAICFTTYSNGELYPISEYSVAAGKYFSDWDAPEDTDFVQKRKVSKVEYPEDRYLGYQSRFAGDVAVVVVDEPFVLTNLVKPVCVDWDSKYVDTHLSSSSWGKVAGWGYDIPENEKLSDDLKQITVSFIDRRQCFKILPRDFQPIITIDKYCAGYTNGTSVCEGDIGGGMVFPQQEYNKKKYYIQGIVSVGPFIYGSCVDYQLAVYTKVDNYIKLIKRTEVSNNVDCNRKQDSMDNSDEDAKILEPLKTGGECPSPVIENGKYEVLGDTKHVPGDPIPNFAILNFTCINDNYALTTVNNLVHCINGNFQSELPKCVPSCAAIFSTSIDVKCKLNDVKLDCSKKLPEGTIATMKCKTHYEEIGSGPSAAICSGGSWDVPLKRCNQECGVLVPKAQLLIVNGTAAKKGEFPWHVAIYRQESGESLRYKCGGSIISVKVVLSAAICFTTYNGELLPLSEFSVAAGKYFSDWDAPEDTDYVQKRKVSKVEYPIDIYFGYQSNYAGDVAVVVVDEPFILTNLIKPVCVDWDSKYVDTHLRNGSLGKVAGWGRNIPKNVVLSINLKQMTVPFIDRKQCFKIVPRDFRQYFTIDKYCAGYTNGTSVCDGDKGGGMVFPQQEYNKKKYYIQGIVSYFPLKNGFCVDHQLTAYTKVKDYIEIIKKVEASNNVDCDGKYCDDKKPEDCLPPVIQNGNYRLITTGEFYTYTSQQPIPNHTLLNITCINNNYVLSTSYSTLYCEEGNYTQEIPKCVLTCSPKFPTSIDVDCKLDGNTQDCTKDVYERTIAHMKCKPGFIDKNPEISNITCLKYGIWSGQPKQCSSPHMCPPRSSTAIDVSCDLNGVKQDCNKEVQEGTISRMECKKNYVDVNDGPSIAFCSNGAWSLPPKKCIPDCAKIVHEGQTQIVNGSSTNRGEFPWHVAIYRQKPQEPIAYICGGSIISVKIVITAAHCLTNLQDGNIHPVSEFFVAAGKMYNKWDATEDEYYVQKRNVSKIHTLQDVYFGHLCNLAGDIAVVVVDQLFIFTNYIIPVCIDWNSEYVHEQLTDGTLGRVAGWGSVTTGTPIASVDLKQLFAPYVSRDKCVQIIPKNFLPYVTVDKYCAGYTNGSSTCRGDSGGGMVFPRINDRIKKYYLQGIVSTAPNKDGPCDNYQLSVYTIVNNYIKFIREIEESNRV